MNTSKFKDNKFVKSLSKVKLNKYYVTCLIFIIITFFIGENTLYKRYQYDSQINDLENEIAQYRKKEAENKKKLESLKSDNESLERFAREEFLMTKPNEELFIIK